MKKAITATMEDYLETIAQLCAENAVARVRDIARRLEVSTASVVGALRTLKSCGLVEQERYGYIRLTAEGIAVANAVVRRHEILRCFLQDVLGLEPALAAADACRLEHAVSAQTMTKLRDIAEFLTAAAHKDLDWPREFRDFCRMRRRSRRI